MSLTILAERAKAEILARVERGWGLYNEEARALIARVTQLEAALISMTKGANWKSADKDNMEFEGRVTCYQLDQARAALENKL